MNHRKTARFAVLLMLLAVVPFSLSAFAQSDPLQDQASEPAELNNDPEAKRASLNDEQLEEGDWDDEALEREEWDEEEEDYDDEEWELEDHEPFEQAKELAVLAGNKRAAFAYTTQLLIESAGEEQALEVLKNILTSTQDQTVRRLVAIRIAELYAELDQPSKIQSLLIEICQ